VRAPSPRLAPAPEPQADPHDARRVTPTRAATPRARARSFCSLYQKSSDGTERSAAEAHHFGRALQSLSRWYSHPKTIVLKITRLPAAYPEGFSFPEGVFANQADYYGRGWCFCESSLCNLVKDFDYVLDLGQLPGVAEGENVRTVVKACRAGRAVPLLPATFAARLEDKSFTSKKADIGIVSSIYEAGFEVRMRRATRFNYTGLEWGDEELATLTEVLHGGGLANAEELFLNMNRITDAGLAAFAAAMAVPDETPPPLAKLVTLNLSGNRIGDVGAQALFRALEQGALGRLRELRLEQNQVSLEWQQKVTSMLARVDGQGNSGSTSGAQGKEEELAYQQGKDAIGKLRKGDVQEVKTMANPPKLVKQAVEAVCILLLRDVEAPTWKHGQKLLNEANFIAQLVELDPTTVGADQLQRLEAYIQDAQFQPEVMKNAGRLAEYLCTWVRGIYNWCRFLNTTSKSRTVE
jgi:hypothetical protein